MLLRELLEDLLQYTDDDMEVKVELIGNEFEDGDVLRIDGDTGTGVQYGVILIRALSNEEGE